MGYVVERILVEIKSLNDDRQSRVRNCLYCSLWMLMLVLSFLASMMLVVALQYRRELWRIAQCGVIPFIVKLQKGQLTTCQLQTRKRTAAQLFSFCFRLYLSSRTLYLLSTVYVLLISILKPTMWPSLSPSSLLLVVCALAGTASAVVSEDGIRSIPVCLLLWLHRRSFS